MVCVQLSIQRSALPGYCDSAPVHSLLSLPLLLCPLRRLKRTPDRLCTPPKQPCCTRSASTVLSSPPPTWMLEREKRETETYKSEQPPTARSSRHSRPSNTETRAGCTPHRGCAPRSRTCHSRAPRRTGGPRSRRLGSGGAPSARWRCGGGWSAPSRPPRGGRGDPKEAEGREVVSWQVGGWSQCQVLGGLL